MVERLGFSGTCNAGKRWGVAVPEPLMRMWGRRDEGLRIWCVTASVASDLLLNTIHALQSPREFMTDELMELLVNPERGLQKAAKQAEKDLAAQQAKAAAQK